MFGFGTQIMVLADLKGWDVTKWEVMVFDVRRVYAT